MFTFTYRDGVSVGIMIAAGVLISYAISEIIDYADNYKIYGLDDDVSDISSYSNSLDESSESETDLVDEAYDLEYEYDLLHADNYID